MHGRGVFTGGAPVVWRSLGQVRAQQDLAVGDSVTFRLFDAQLSDVETHKIELQEGEAGSNQWPFYLAQEVNLNSSLVKIGVLDSSGNISPVKSSQDNNVYVSSEQEFSFQIDIEMVDNGGGGTDCDCCDSCTDPGPNPDPTGDADFIYPDGIGSYVGGTVVQGTNGKRYECKPFPFSGWCNQSELYYAPGTGLAWTDAWISLD